MKDKKLWSWSVGAPARDAGEFGSTRSGCANSRNEAIRQCIEHAECSLMRRDNFAATISPAGNFAAMNPSLAEDVTGMLKTHVRVEEAAAYLAASNLGLEHVMWGSRSMRKGSKSSGTFGRQPEAIDLRYIRQHALEALCDGSSENEAERCWKAEYGHFLRELKSRAKKRYWLELILKRLGFEVL